MAILDLDSAVEDGEVQVTNRADGSRVTEDQVFTEQLNETITLWQGSGLTITELRVSGKTQRDWPGTSHLRRSSVADTLRSAQGNDLLRVEFMEDRAVLKDLNSSPEPFNYKFGITIQIGGQSYDWDPEVDEEPPSSR